MDSRHHGIELLRNVPATTGTEGTITARLGPGASRPTVISCDRYTLQVSIGWVQC